MYLVINLKHFVAVLVDKPRMVGVDHVVTMMILITTNREKIHLHQSMDLLHGHHAVECQDVVQVMVQWNNAPNRVINGVILMIEQVREEKHRT